MALTERFLKLYCIVYIVVCLYKHSVSVCRQNKDTKGGMYKVVPYRSCKNAKLTITQPKITKNCIIQYVLQNQVNKGICKQTSRIPICLLRGIWGTNVWGHRGVTGMICEVKIHNEVIKPGSPSYLWGGYIIS